MGGGGKSAEAPTLTNLSMPLYCTCDQQGTYLQVGCACLDALAKELLSVQCSSSTPTFVACSVQVTNSGVRRSGYKANLSLRRCLRLKLTISFVSIGNVNY